MSSLFSTQLPFNSRTSGLLQKLDSCQDFVDQQEKSILQKVIQVFISYVFIPTASLVMVPISLSIDLIDRCINFEKDQQHLYEFGAYAFTLLFRIGQYLFGNSGPLFAVDYMHKDGNSHPFYFLDTLSNSMRDESLKQIEENEAEAISNMSAKEKFLYQLTKIDRGLDLYLELLDQKRWWTELNQSRTLDLLRFEDSIQKITAFLIEKCQSDLIHSLLDFETFNYKFTFSYDKIFEFATRDKNIDLLNRIIDCDNNRDLGPVLGRYHFEKMIAIVNAQEREDIDDYAPLIRSFLNVGEDNWITKDMWQAIINRGNIELGRILFQAGHETLTPVLNEQLNRRLPDPQIVEMLIDIGIDPNTHFNPGLFIDSPLTRITSKFLEHENRDLRPQYKHLIQLLIQKGASPAHLSPQFFYWSLLSQDEELIDLCLDNNPQAQDLLRNAFKKEVMSRILILDKIDNANDPWQKQVEKENEQNSLTLIMKLLDMGTNVNDLMFRYFDQNYTAIRYAIKTIDINLMNFLLDQNAINEDINDLCINALLLGDSYLEAAKIIIRREEIDVKRLLAHMHQLNDYQLQFILENVHLQEEGLNFRFGNESDPILRGHTPLTYALATKRSKSLIQTLLNKPILRDLESLCEYEEWNEQINRNEQKYLHKIPREIAEMHYPQELVQTWFPGEEDIGEEGNFEEELVHRDALEEVEGL